jgi:hypothetical protein
VEEVGHSIALSKSECNIVHCALTSSHERLQQKQCVQSSAVHSTLLNTLMVHESCIMKMCSP